jgi:uncharacterized protein (TIGR02466 family)
MVTYQLFPEPVYFSKLERVLTKTELKTIAQYKQETTKTVSNKFSTNSYVLENKTFKNLKNDLDKMVIDYFNKIVCSSNSISPYITQSWITYTDSTEFLPSHAHPNSYVSGIFYIDAKAGIDNVRFYKAGYQQIKPRVSKYNIFNSESWKFSIETGDVLLFPSSLQHGVESKKGANTRISLSFNVFMKGKIGDNQALTELVLK